MSRGKNSTDGRANMHVRARRVQTTCAFSAVLVDGARTFQPDHGVLFTFEVTASAAARALLYRCSGTACCCDDHTRALRHSLIPFSLPCISHSLSHTLPTKHAVTISTRARHRLASARVEPARPDELSMELLMAWLYAHTHATAEQLVAGSGSSSAREESAPRRAGALSPRGEGDARRRWLDWDSNSKRVSRFLVFF